MHITSSHDDKGDPIHQMHEESFVCIGGPRHGTLWTPEFTSLDPADYEKFSVSCGDESIMTIFSHTSLSESECLEKFAEWINQNVQHVE